MALEIVKEDGRRQSLNSDLRAWIQEADRWYERYRRMVGESPFQFHEVAGVGFLSCAAARAGFLTLNEYELKKRSQQDRRFKVAGRADLWMMTPSFAYQIEFKRAWHEATVSNLREALSSARGDIRVVPDDECHYAIAGLFAYVTDRKRWDRYMKFAEEEEVTAAYRIGPKGPDAVFIYFSVKS